MIDLETMGTGSNAAIIAIGAVKFDHVGIVDEFYKVVSLESSVKNGMTIEPDTVLWWMKQSVEARKEFERKGGSLCRVLLTFYEWFGQDKPVWGNGASFDNVILSNAYKLTGLEQPWNFWSDRCYRTLKSLYPSIEVNRSGTHHNALDDAKSQALHLIEIFKHAGLEL